MKWDPVCSILFHFLFNFIVTQAARKSTKFSTQSHSLQKFESWNDESLSRWGPDFGEDFICTKIRVTMSKSWPDNRATSFFITSVFKFFNNDEWGKHLTMACDRVKLTKTITSQTASLQSFFCSAKIRYLHDFACSLRQQSQMSNVTK